jgi:hypothetical protein
MGLVRTRRPAAKVACHARMGACLSGLMLPTMRSRTILKTGVDPLLQLGNRSRTSPTAPPGASPKGQQSRDAQKVLRLLAKKLRFLGFERTKPTFFTRPAWYVLEFVHASGRASEFTLASASAATTPWPHI